MQPTFDSGVPDKTHLLACSQHRVGSRADFSSEEIRDIKAERLDFLLAFGAGNLEGEVLDCARYGVWSFHGPPDPDAPAPASSYWSIHHGEASTYISLFRIPSASHAGGVLRDGRIGTDAKSYTGTLGYCLGILMVWPAQVCVDIANGNIAYLQNTSLRFAPPVSESPRNLQVIQFLFRLGCNAVRYQLKRMLLDKWNIGIVHCSTQEFIESPETPIHFLPLYAESYKFAADPFGCWHDGSLVVFFEDYDYRDRKGRISYVVLASGAIVSRGVAIDEPHHLSYPFLTEHGGDLYCMPESAAAGAVRLYKCLKFPHKWEPHSVLLDGVSFVDSTITFHEGKWWLFASGGANDALLIYFAEDLFGPWCPHLNNPVKIDIHASRPAGYLFRRDGQLYRPAQDCAPEYGGRVVVNRITALSSTEFSEEIDCTISPMRNGDFSAGLHTISGAGGMTLVDGKKQVFAIGFLFQRILNRAARKWRQS